MKLARATVLLFATFCFVSAGSFDYNVCKSGAGSTCFSLPTKCWEATTPACLVLFHSKYDKGQLNFDLVSSSITADHYIALGLSKSNKMSGLVSACYHSSSDSSNKLVYAFNSYNAHKNNQITNQTLVKGFVGSDTKSNTFQAGELHCRWQVNNNTKLEVSYLDNRFDFKTEQYYVQLASGPVVDPITGKLGYHGEQKISSTQLVNFTTTTTEHVVVVIQAATAGDWRFDNLFDNFY